MDTISSNNIIVIIHIKHIKTMPYLLNIFKEKKINFFFFLLLTHNLGNYSFSRFINVQKKN